MLVIHSKLITWWLQTCACSDWQNNFRTVFVSWGKI